MAAAKKKPAKKVGTKTKRKAPAPKLEQRVHPLPQDKQPHPVYGWDRIPEGE